MIYALCSIGILGFFVWAFFYDGSFFFFIFFLIIKNNNLVKIKKKLKILLYAETNLKFIISNIFINLNLYINVLRNYLKLKFNQQETNLYFYFIILESSETNTQENFIN